MIKHHCVGVLCTRDCTSIELRSVLSRMVDRGVISGDVCGELRATMGV